jgi:hypothetical protein
MTRSLLWNFQIFGTDDYFFIIQRRRQSVLGSQGFNFVQGPLNLPTPGSQKGIIFLPHILNTLAQ